MSSKNSKRYLITYKDEEIDSAKASGILGVAKSKCKEGVSFMETESVPKKEDILHFSELGISSIELTEDEHAELTKKEGVLAVEEDIEVKILEVSQEEEQTEIFSSNIGQNNFDTNGQYADGYHHAMINLLSSILQLSSQELETIGSGIRPVEPIPRRPFRPIPFPPTLPKQPVPWNISMIKAPQAWSRGIKGDNVKVAVLDTGIANHSDLKITGGVSFVDGVTSFNDGHSHGTHCAGIIGARNNIIGVIGVAPLCKLYAVKVLSDSGSGYSSWVIAGMDWCVKHKIDVASMSLGSSSAPSVAYANAVRRCQEKGVTVVTAAGNSGNTSYPFVGSPANSYQRQNSKASPIAVGAVNQSNMLASFSSRGGENSEWNGVTVVAPGVSIKSTVLNNSYAFKSGTSMACPHVSGLAALIIQQYPGISPVNVVRRITSTSFELGNAGYDELYGYGLINCNSATM
jgi:subtilisin